MTDPPSEYVSDKPTYSHRAKIVVVGDAAVGKTSLIVRYVKGVFNPSYIITLGVNFFVQDINIGDKTLRLQIWDTAGQERFGPVRQKYYKGARGALLVFDLANPTSFERLDFWIKEVKQACGDIPIVFVGNKADLRSGVTSDQIQEFASGYDLQYVETSAKTGMNTVKPFILLAPQILDIMDE
ncbi:MAG: Rab family GTPase [Candidatus Hermodarchaeia archaeon]|jgi:small GTP-binding protein